LKIEWGLKALLLAEKLSHHGNGKFDDAVELTGVPRSSAYTYRQMARAHLESLSRIETNSQDLDPDGTSIDMSDPEDMKRVLELAYKGPIPPRPKRHKPYVKVVQLHFIFDSELRRRVRFKPIPMKRPKR
jgi:hypothetical protein